MRAMNWRRRGPNIKSAYSAIMLGCVSLRAISKSTMNIVASNRESLAASTFFCSLTRFLFCVMYAKGRSTCEILKKKYLFETNYEISHEWRIFDTANVNVLRTIKSFRFPDKKNKYIIWFFSLSARIPRRCHCFRTFQLFSIIHLEDILLYFQFFFIHFFWMCVIEIKFLILKSDEWKKKYRNTLHDGCLI